MGEEGARGKFYFVGNYLCLDFINTRIVADGRPVDLLAGLDDLIGWSVEADVLDQEQARKMLATWRGKGEAADVFVRALKFRDTLRAMTERIVAGRAIPQSIIDSINEAQRGQNSYVVLARVNGKFEKHLSRSFDAPAQLLAPVAESASDLLSEGDLSLVRKCENPRCVLYFYDTTKNHQRRWCSMSGCGNRAKVAAHYRRKRETADGESR